MLTDIASYGLINPVPAVVEEVLYIWGMHIYMWPRSVTWEDGDH